MNAKNIVIRSFIIFFIGLLYINIYSLYVPGDSIAFIILASKYFCTHPRLIVPYLYFCLKMYAEKNIEFISPFFCGFIFPIILILLPVLSGEIGINSEWDKLIESNSGRIVLIFVILLPGIFLPHLSLKYLKKIKIRKQIFC